MGKKLSNDEFIKRASILHNNKYLYNKTEYTLSNKKVIIICEKHGEFEQEANSHLRGVGCPSCSGNIKSNNKIFIEKSNLIHHNIYDYSKVEYKSAFLDVLITCKEHGDFQQRPNNHLNGHGCIKCGYDNISIKNSRTLDEFLIDAIKIHGDRFDYSLVEYNPKKVKIVCKKHGIFYQNPNNHLNGQGCKKCLIDKNRKRMTKTLDEFLIEAIKVHGDRFDYSLVEYTGTDNKIKIVCKKHGIFTQKCSKHLQNQGCPTCSESKLEKEIRLLLTSNNIKYKQQYGSKLDDFYLNGQKLDFYLPEYKLAIECQGDQHFRPVDFGNKGEEYALISFKNNILRDFKKYLECLKNDIEIIYYCNKSNLDSDYIGEIYCEFDGILKKINKI